MSDAPRTDEPTTAAVAHIHRRAARIERRELARALARLDGDLSPAQREAVAAMADRLVAALLEPADAGLRAAADAGDERTVAVALSLFGGDE